MTTFPWMLLLSLIAPGESAVNFDRAAVDKLPPGWTVSGGPAEAANWKVRPDSSARTQPNVLIHAAVAGAGDRESAAVLEGQPLRDADVSIRLRASAGHPQQAAGLVWRYQDENNYYYVRADAVRHQVGVFKVQKGRTVSIAAPATHNIAPGTWTVLKVSARGGTFRVYLDHRTILRGSDATFSGPGRSGLYAPREGEAVFDDFHVVPR
jgi:hypothetical protein